MALENAVAAALLTTFAAVLTALSVLSLRRYRTRSFAVLTVAFSLICVEGIGISLVALDVVSSSEFPLSLIAGLQAAALLLIYAATFRRG